MIPKVIKTFQLTFPSLQLHDSHSIKRCEPPSLVFSRVSQPNFRHVSTIRILFIYLFILHLPHRINITKRKRKISIYYY